MRPANLALVLLALAIAPAAARAQDLERTLERFAAAWARGDVDNIVAMAVDDGVMVETGDDPMGPLGRRQAAALLKRVFEDRATVSFRTDILRQVASRPASAFSEVVWISRAEGTRIPESRRVFLAFVNDGAGWRISQIRILR